MPQACKGQQRRGRPNLEQETIKNNASIQTLRRREEMRCQLVPQSDVHSHEQARSDME
jgi:hypothetical protein